MTARRFGVLVAGVGGQGVLTAARILGEAALAEGLHVVVGQLHGMSQRGGSVESTVRIGPGHGSFLGPGECDVLLALEPVEAVRAISRVTKRTRALVSRGAIAPFTLAQEGRPYPDVERLLAALRAAAGEVIAIDAPALAGQAGAPRALNLVMLGALAARGGLPVPAEAIERAIESAHPGDAAGALAFRLGCQQVAR